ncbi:MAG: cyclic nucleotide-binding domain-containing protein [Leptospiraceae bacterium]|nr:cyclic nucleotide-binding domain-containing protein [Leptospiraceae bacterium]
MSRKILLHSDNHAFDNEYTDMKTLILFLLILFSFSIYHSIYSRYFSRSRDVWMEIEFFLFGGAVSLLTLLTYNFLPLPNYQSALYLGFVKAAFPEKLSMFFLLLFLKYHRSRNLELSRGISLSVMAAMGFATIENLYYSMHTGTEIIFFRLLSSVPLHLTTCGMMGYFLGISTLSENKKHRTKFLAKAFAYPFLLHGSFDALLLKSGNSSYLGFFLLFLLVIILDYFIAKSLAIPSGKELAEKNVGFENWDLYQKQNQFERWILRSLETIKGEFDPLFQWKIGKKKLIVLFLILTVPAFFYFQNQTLPIGENFLKPQELYSLFVLLPFAFSINLILVGIVNPAYFKNSVLKIPVITNVEIIHANRIAFEICYDLNSERCFIKTSEPVQVGEFLKLKFKVQEFESGEVEGKVVSDNHKNLKEAFGTIIEFTDRNKSFEKFLRKYARFKFQNGIKYNFHFTGFEWIRGLFIQPESVLRDLRFFPAGTKLFEEGEKGREFFLIKKGSVTIFRNSTTSERVVLEVLPEGSIFGEMAIAGETPRNASAVCETDSVLMVATNDDLENLISGNPEFAKRLLKISAERYINSTLKAKAISQKMEENFEKIKLGQAETMKFLLLNLGLKVRHGEIQIKLDDSFFKKVKSAEAKIYKKLISEILEGEFENFLQNEKNLQYENFLASFTQNSKIKVQ